jgi:general secretion pathway protein D
VSSYNFRTVGISVRATPRLVTEEGDILLEMEISNDTLGPTRLVGGAPAPSFPTRAVTAKLRLRDGESHLIAGLLQDDERRSMTGVPGVLSVPVLKYLFAASDDTIAQTDIVMLLTPRIIRTHEFQARDLSPIYVGTNQNFGLTGQPAPGAPPAPAPAAPSQLSPPTTPTPGFPQTSTPGPVAVPPATPPGAVVPQSQAAPPAVQPQSTAGATTTTLTPTADVSITPPAGEMRVGAGPYTVPIYVNNVARAATVTLTVTYNPAVLRMRMVQEGSFLRQGGFNNVVFTPNSDTATGRVDLAFVRTADTVGASGSGLLAAFQFDAVGAGSSQLTISGVMQNPTGGTIPVRFAPATIVVR